MGFTWALDDSSRHWRLYRDHLVCVCLAQGAAKHMIDGTTGIKDFDLYRIFTATKRRPQPDPAIYRGRTVNFGESRLGQRTDWWGQRVRRDVGAGMVRYLEHKGISPAEMVKAVRAGPDGQTNTTRTPRLAIARIPSA